MSLSGRHFWWVIEPLTNAINVGVKFSKRLIRR
jgi:hypothetical protein